MIVSIVRLGIAAVVGLTTLRLIIAVASTFN
jgi:hypothetical protein